MTSDFTGMSVMTAKSSAEIGSPGATWPERQPVVRALHLLAIMLDAGAATIRSSHFCQAEPG